MHTPSDFAGRQSEATAEELKAQVARMAKIGSCYSPSFSPDGKRVTFISDLNGTPQVWIVPTEGGWPELITNLDDQVQQVSWSPDGLWLAFSLAPGGGMNQQVYLVHPDGTELHRLTDGGKENNWLGGWTHDGRSLTLVSNRRDPSAMDAYLVDIESGELRLVAENEGVGVITDVSRDGHYAILYRMESRSDDNLFLLDLITGKTTLLTPHEGPGSFEEGKFAPDGHTIYLSSNKGRELVAFARVQLSQNGGHGRPGEIEVIAGREDAELSGFEISEDGTTAVLLWNVAGRNELAFLNLATLQYASGPTVPGELVSGISWSKDGNLLALTVSGSALPRNIWVYELASQQFQQITKSPHAGVNLATLVRPELIRFTAHDGLPLSGWLYQPPDKTAPGALVIDFHGGPEGQARPSFNYIYQALLAQGIAVFAPNVRGSSGFGKTFVNLDNGPLRFNALKDIKACVDYMLAAGIAHPQQVGIMGGSYGGYMTMAGLTEYPDLFAAGANLFGIVNFETFFAHTEPWMAAVSTIEYGDPRTQADLLRALSPIHKIDRVQSATLVLHGANDTNVPV
ncbi:MAG TPA: prolyl oligopeptidase family serine peptidase, partial [Ktedonobacteraceae bacterium]|nr:prolyl oligopeptidase family serine peptidase [Ktedonobacteraceae bacterium]